MLTNLLPWPLRSRKSFRLWLDIRVIYWRLRQARKAGHALLSVSAGIVLE